TSKPLCIHCRPSVGIGTFFQKPRGNFQFIVFNGQMKQRGSRNRREMQSVTRLETQFRREYLRLAETFVQQAGIAIEMLFEQSDAATMECHARLLRQGESLRSKNLETFVFA